MSAGAGVAARSCGRGLRVARLRGGVRWTVPAVIVAAEYLGLSLLVDLPMAGPAMTLVRPLRMLGPVLFGAAAAGWLIARGESRGGTGAAPLPPLPAWRPWPTLALQAGAYAVTAATAVALLRPGAPPPSPAAMAVFIACAAATGLLALRAAAPLGWLLAALARRWLAPLVALSVGLLAWRAASAAEGLWGALTAVTLHAAGALASAAGAEIQVDPARSVIRASGVRIEIAPICSGVDGIGLVVLFQAVWIALARERIRWERALVLLPLGAAAALAGNVLRVAALTLLAAAGRPDLAFGGFHSKLGWAFFIAIALGSVAIAERSRWLARPADAEGSAAAGVPPGAGAYAAPFVAMLATALVTSMLAGDGLDRLYGLRVAAGAGVLLAVRRRLPVAVLAPALLPIAAGLAVGAAWVALAGGDGTAVSEGLARMGPAERAAWISARVAGACLLVPVVEELAFRGFLLPWLVSPGFRDVPPRAWSWPAALGSSLAFGAIHSQWLLGAAAGLAFAGVRRWRGRLGDAVLAHAVANAAIAAAVLGAGRWGLWGG
ncbi:CAAX prenyl protease-related protein [Anaeromyxobacter dehalogenans 2CP-1]|uniref:CAAX prenyl protease-related protein n=1 Tax=Anaeromyxobacter dehalogenans (strain ATCC BAA-258 / DSM 21875 / 2CP-1) TaxID=455488 RepID=B8JEG6_ANAD2|nr:exosortase E/protease, VPEID-CTERM system [Anaeromyxobacter dehalogenans]ACL64292.1 CAAX prenyl protease-related protein [Anaeromyxobacter dehalogenans 2CP-1]